MNYTTDCCTAAIEEELLFQALEEETLEEEALWFEAFKKEDLKTKGDRS